jgi:hypothetical protein
MDFGKTSVRKTVRASVLFIEHDHAIRRDLLAPADGRCK